MIIAVKFFVIPLPFLILGRGANMSKKALCLNRQNYFGNIKSLFLIIFVLPLLLSACSNTSSTMDLETETDTSSSSSSSSNSSLAPSESVPVTDTESVPHLSLNNDFYSRRFSDPLPDDMIPQLICTDETAVRLALTIQQLLEMGTAQLPFFDNNNPLDTDAAAKIAIFNTAPIDLSGSEYTATDGFRWNDHPDHPITMRLAQLYKQGNSPTDVIYAEDVSVTLERLFGITDWTHHTVDWYYYFPEEGVYITYGEMVRRGKYPQLLSWEETENGYSCEVILTDAWFGTVNDQEVTEENIEELAAEVPHYVFTFNMVDGEPIVTSFTEAG